MLTRNNMRPPVRKLLMTNCLLSPTWSRRRRSGSDDCKWILSQSCQNLLLEFAVEVQRLLGLVLKVVLVNSLRENMLHIEQLSAQVIDGPQILNGLSLNVPAGEVHAIMGPNGSGKVRLLYTGGKARQGLVVVSILMT